MTLNFTPILLLSLALLGCGENQHNPNPGAEGAHHQHTAPHGGTLVEVGPHGSGFNLELILEPEGVLQIYILDAHAENFVRISAESIVVELLDHNQSTSKIICKAVEDPGTGETLGNSSLFSSTQPISGFISTKANIAKLSIKEQVYKNISFDLSLNSKN
jgi:hypothetical protein